ncbi:DedA family protein [Candidatus Woesearchaeota archaeon]|nr:DedA family protein [Candidatus Woesearchaeota archaeon]
MLFERLSELFTGIIASTGYLGVFVLMTLESMVAPVPSELVMPFAGFLVADGKLNLWLVIFVSALASITGSLISYFVAYFGEKELIHRFGKFVFLDNEELEWTQRWFTKRGSITILISRFIPVIRHLISIPAGLARMDLKRFILFTAVGATALNTFLLWVGMQLREKWEIVHRYSKQLDVLIVALIVIAVAYYGYKHWKRHRKKRDVLIFSQTRR